MIKLALFFALFAGSVSNAAAILITYDVLGNTGTVDSTITHVSIKSQAMTIQTDSVATCVIPRSAAEASGLSLGELSQLIVLKNVRVAITCNRKLGNENPASSVDVEIGK